MSHPRGRAFRRYQAELAKRRTRKVLRDLWHWQNPDPRAIGRHASVHCTFCSSPWCCGNRRLWGGPTSKEILAALSEAESLTALHAGHML